MTDDIYTHIAQHIKNHQIGTRRKIKHQLVLFFLLSVMIPASLSVSYGRNTPTTALKIIECR